eukprot:COSAG01_NODE_40624_length_461_cov_1.251381_1_plen_45_part_01
MGKLQYVRHMEHAPIRFDSMDDGRGGLPDTFVIGVRLRWMSVRAA